MAGRVPLARRILFADRRRATLAAFGIATALVLVLALDGIFAGAMSQVTAYLRASPADVIVSQQGVRTMHMSSSSLPADTVTAARAVPGVAWADGIGFTSTFVASGAARQLTYVIGYDTTSGRGGPEHLVAGRAPQSGQAVLDRVAAARLGVGVGGRITALGASWTVSGESSGGTSIANTTTFVPAGDFARLRGPAVSYVLVGAQPGVAVSALAARVSAALPRVTVQTRTGFVAQEAGLVRDMSADILRIMTIVGLLIALAVVGLSLFALTLAKLRDYAVLKALGSTNSRLAATVAAQAAWSIGTALCLAVGLTWVLGVGVARISPTIRIVIEPASVARVAVGALAAGAVGAVIPLRRVRRVDPASVFRTAS